MFSWFRRKVQSDEVSPQWMVVHATDNLSEAHIIAGRLKNEGIPSWVHQQPGASGLGITIGLFGEVRVLVNTEDYERAVQILEIDVDPPLLEDDLSDVRYLFPENDGESETDEKFA